MIQIHGDVEEGYGAIADEFTRLFSDRGETGANLSILVAGRVVVDIWGGSADLRTGRQWDADTLSVIFSCTKGLMTIAALTLVAEGKLDLGARVTNYWPEFGKQGKEAVLVEWLFQHRAGLVAVDRDLTLDDVIAWGPVIEAIEDQTPLWLPGASHGYHTLTHGWLVGEIIRRVTGETPGTYFRALVEQLAPNTWLGVPERELPRIARLAWGEDPAGGDEQDWESEDPGVVAALRSSTLGAGFPLHLVDPEDGDFGFNDPRVLQAEVPGAGAVSTARDLASIWSATVTATNGVRLLERELTDAVSVPVSYGQPYFGGEPPFNAWGTGFEVSSERRPMLTASSFGHSGLGGQLAFADPDALVGFAFLSNRLTVSQPGRADALVAALSSVRG
jgi:CubicO group peptidase (beta-lactamase class C family)